MKTGCTNTRVAQPSYVSDLCKLAASDVDGRVYVLKSVHTTELTSKHCSADCGPVGCCCKTCYYWSSQTGWEVWTGECPDVDRLWFVAYYNVQTETMLAAVSDDVCVCPYESRGNGPYTCWDHAPDDYAVLCRGGGDYECLCPDSTWNYGADIVAQTSPVADVDYACVCVSDGRVYYAEKACYAYNAWPSGDAGECGYVSRVSGCKYDADCCVDVDYAEKDSCVDESPGLCTEDVVANTDARVECCYVSDTSANGVCVDDVVVGQCKTVSVAVFEQRVEQTA